MKAERLITEKTGLSIGVIATLIGFILWLTNIHSASVSNAGSISKLEEANARLSSDVQKLLIITAETKTKVEYMYEKQRGK